jgi:hypothetical protein
MQTELQLRLYSFHALPDRDNDSGMRFALYFKLISKCTQLDSNLSIDIDHRTAIYWLWKLPNNKTFQEALRIARKS